MKKVLMMAVMMSAVSLAYAQPAQPAPAPQGGGRCLNGPCGQQPQPAPAPAPQPGGRCTPQGCPPNPPAQPNPDAQSVLYHKIRNQLSQQFNGKYDASVFITVQDNNRILIQGSVNDLSERNEVAKAVSAVPGVTSIDNQLAIQGQVIQNQGYEN